ncbi:M60 family metallopeptidase [Verrucomicrobium spinosum]|uniref:M60 family metallopeptidase n=1 Tax=Verrucomicrobium spinosum TaxID=2736 RepID=UPI00017445F8|nr:M60 family metallopeptidase [Verrucomicrobium spinosum]
MKPLPLTLALLLALSQGVGTAQTALPIRPAAPGTAPTPAATPGEWQNAERAKILSGVSSIPRLGAPGPVAIWGNLAFPVISAAETGKPELALAAAAGYGKGRLMLFGHNSYLSAEDAGDGGMGTLLLNAVRWVGNKEKPRIGVKGSNLIAFLDKKGLRAEKMDGPLEKKTLNDYDVVILNAQGITDPAEGQAAIEYIKGGGGIIAAMTGWAFEQTSGGKALSIAHGFNNAIMPTGLAFTDSSGFDAATIRQFSARTELPRMMNAFDAITAIKKQREGGPSLNPDDIGQGTNAIQVALAAQPPGRNSLQGAVMGALGEGDSGVPTREQPLTMAQHASQRIRLGMETRVLRLASSPTVAAHPASAVFPGQPAKDAPRVTKEITVDANIDGWTSTGLYAVAGEPITVTVPEAMVGNGFSIRVGCHSDTLYHLESWRRAPDITRTVGIENVETKMGTAFGGLVYITVPGRARRNASEPFKVKIAGAVESPYFKLGRDTDEQWNNIKKAQGPWAELAGEKMVVSLPSEVARKITNPTELMEFWDRVVTAQDDISNQTAERTRPERMVADVQISAGFMHSGYPIMIHTPESAEMVTYGRIKYPGWGFYHEIGHNHQRGNFTFEGTGEVTNNVFGLYCYTEVLKKELLIGHGGVSPESIKKHIDAAKKAKDQGEKWAIWKGDPFHALTTYVQLVQGFGWENYKKYIWSFADPSFGPTPKNDEEKRDQFLIRFSKITKKNLGPFFEFWGIPVTSSAKAEVSKLEPWMPKEL